MPVLSLACHLPHNTPNIPSRYNNEQTTKQTKAINNSYIYIYISCKCDTNRAGHFTLDAYASKPVACNVIDALLPSIIKFELVVNTLQNTYRVSTSLAERSKVRQPMHWRYCYWLVPHELNWQARTAELTYYNDVIMDNMASQIISLTIVYSIVYSGVDQRKHQSPASLAFVRGIHRWPVNSPHKRPVTRKMKK